MRVERATVPASRLLLLHGVLLLHVAMETIQTRGMHSVHPHRSELHTQVISCRIGGWGWKRVGLCMCWVLGRGGGIRLSCVCVCVCVREGVGWAKLGSGCIVWG